MSAISDATVDALVAKGIRNVWHPICPASWITGKPLSLHRCGHRIVLWRDSKGTAHALEDRCPHRGAPLSRGIVLDDRIACGYHGVQVDHQGVVAKVPGSPGCKLEGTKSTRAFPLQEQAGAIFAYIGDELHPQPPPLVLPQELTAAQYSHFLCYAEWRGDYRYVYDNVMDPMHGSYLHRQSHSMSFGDQSAKFEKEGQRNVNFDWTEFQDTGAHWMKLEIPYPPTGGPGGNFHIVGIYAPISENECAVFHWRCRRVDGWQRDTWRFLYKNRLEQRHWHVLEQDRAMLEDFAADARDHEILYQHDMGLVRLRRYFRAKARAQLTALAQAQQAATGAAG
jgi:phenylpropionate dioxygenase-like ring-hydroxylating dioxygenase large terminal subunit